MQWMWLRLEKVGWCPYCGRSRINSFVDKLADGFLEGGRDLFTDFAKVGKFEIDVAVFGDLSIMNRICNQKMEGE